MKCDFCDNKASVFLTQLIHGQMKKVCLCDQCAKERGVTDPTGFSLAELLLGDIAPTSPQIQPFAGGPSTRRCPTCGFSIEDLRKVRRFGCSDCYATFSEEVAHMLHGMHKGPTHVGKIPGGLMARQVLHKRLEDLRSLLNSAITSESYEEAAHLRDQIKSLEQADPHLP
jgi:protein arginine kinase activator